ncbi:MAG: hypothetical protein WD490_10330 [Opitutales bacterium]
MTTRAAWVLALGAFASLLAPIIGPAVAMGGAIYAFILGVGLLDKGGVWRGGLVILFSVLLCALAIPLSSLGTGGWLGSKAGVLNDPLQRSFERNTRYGEPLHPEEEQPVEEMDNAGPVRMVTPRQVQLRSESGELSTLLILFGEEVEVIERNEGILTIRYQGGIGQIPAHATDLED